MGFTAIRELFPSPIPPFRTKPGPKRPEPAPAPKPVAAPAPAPTPQAVCACSWLYCDTKGNVQGPFLSNQMSLWFEHKMLPKDLKLRRTTDGNFATIIEFFPKPALPFQTTPVTPLSLRLMSAAANPQPQRPVGHQDAAGTNGNFAKAVRKERDDALEKTKALDSELQEHKSA